MRLRRPTLICAVAMATMMALVVVSIWARPPGVTPHCSSTEGWLGTSRVIPAADYDAIALRALSNTGSPDPGDSDLKVWHRVMNALSRNISLCRRRTTRRPAARRVWAAAEYVVQTCTLAEQSGEDFTCGGTRGTFSNFATHVMELK